MFKIEFRAKGGGFKKIITDLDNKDKLVQAELQRLGQQSEIKMKTIIKSSKKRPQAGEKPNLGEAIEVTYFPNGWGVGEISKLDREAIYWKAVNYGSNHMVGRNMPGTYFSPGEPRANRDSFRQGRLKPQRTGGTGKGIPVSRPIPPMNFIEKTITYVKHRLTHISSILRRR